MAETRQDQGSPQQQGSQALHTHHLQTTKSVCHTKDTTHNPLNVYVQDSISNVHMKML